MFSFKNKLPLGLFALCAVSIVGMKDTGVFINEHVQKAYSGNEIDFSIGEKVEVLERKGNDYFVQKGKAKVTIPQDKILLTEVNVPTYKVVKASPILDDNGKIIRSLFVDEYAIGVSTNNDKAKIKCNDGTVGNVDIKALKKVADKRNNVTNVEVKNKTVATSDNGKKLNLNKKQVVNVVDFADGLFVIEYKGTNYNVPAKDLDIVSGIKIEKEEENNSDSVISNDEKEIQEAIKNKNVIKVNFEAKKAPGPNASIAAKVISSAEDKLGSTYVYGDTGKAGFDCSGLVYSIYNDELGISIPRSSRTQSTFGQQVSKSDLQEGDLVFFNTTGNGVSHVGIYVGDGKFIHASSGQGKVMTSSLSEEYYQDRYVNATRVL
ncbi:MAG: C40 family peptidase [Peptoniphilus harei]|uniref:C40 family peptidase n=2 Tax=Peptoniphilus harei TaxID=54005 RepID=UPI0028FED5AC|nr:C40 family peptidase [Peptoniphilus harei]MDU1176001.1 C40 family peptidase [Peptoniphilus harei]MDU5471246.1 C40 family peptidase [Peptoniphilus harei]MDU6097556.1 C40 family peptidase [Peptoniphilus harei]